MGVNLMPYSNVHELNLDWILAELKKMYAEWQETLSKLSGYDFEQLKKRVDDLEKVIEDLENEVLDIAESELPAIIAKYLKVAIFVQIDNGYITFTIPSTWNDITFRTSELDEHNTGLPYGHLLLEY